MRICFCVFVVIVLLPLFVVHMEGCVSNWMRILLYTRANFDNSDHVVCCFIQLPKFPELSISVVQWHANNYSAWHCNYVMRIPSVTRTLIICIRIFNPLCCVQLLSAVIFHIAPKE